jgi:Zn-dependent alcohol dehydrogenase
MYEGRTDVEKGKILGYENLGEVLEVGKAVDFVKKGDRVVLTFNIGCGFCANCERGLSGYCLTCADPDVMPGMAGAAYGFAGMGPYSGGQSEYLRVPYGDYNCLQVAEDADEKETDYVILSDIFPTGWHATRLACLCPGESIVIYWGGPVGPGRIGRGVGFFDDTSVLALSKWSYASSAQIRHPCSSTETRFASNCDRIGQRLDGSVPTKNEPQPKTLFEPDIIRE